ncbi:protein FAM43A-like [Saccoglossus kowalevskii]|uniref:Protein FAM43A-like n=1 Tax=Saccoglossus kowalevskii TaxID=10224 RepID=A0ABM0M184_SACKO|nr:PREDICTED: protein FAM43A-like [Saccoglossus kowalevskii]
MISIFKRKKQHLTITADNPTYTVYYLGNAHTLLSNGEGCCDSQVERVWTRSKQGKKVRKVNVTITARGLKLDFLDKPRRGPSAQFYLLHRISYCVADRSNQKIFAWVYRHELKRKAVELRCHAVLCNKSEKAKAMALCLYQIFTSSFVDYKRERKDRERRNKADPYKPPLPLRRILNGASKFHPPLDRSRSAPKLCAIREDKVREEAEEEEMNQNTVFRDDTLLDMSDRMAHIAIGNDVSELQKDSAVTELLRGDTHDDSRNDPIPAT